MLFLLIIVSKYLFYKVIDINTVLTSLGKLEDKRRQNNLTCRFLHGIINGAKEVFLQ